MSIAALYDLQERLNSSAIAGVNMIGEDFRLHRAIEQFSQAASASPVFQRIAQQLQPLTLPDTPSKAAALMDALALIDAVLYTQGATQVNGEVEPIASNGSPYVASRYSDLQPLKQALTEKGSGRYEIVRSAFESQSPALHDYRLKANLIVALGDSYSDMADLVKNVLAAEDDAVIPLLKQQFDPKGKREMARRVEVIEQIAKERENAFYISLLDGSSSTVREAAVHALKHEEQNTDILIQLAETEKGAVKTAAYASLVHMNNDRAAALWLKHAQNNPADVEDYLDDNVSDAISDVVAQNLAELIVPLLEEKRFELEPKEVEKLRTALRMTINKSSASLISLYEKLAEHQKELGKLRDKQTAQLLNLGRADSSLLEEINLKLIEGMVSGLNAELLPAVERLYRSHGQVYLHAGFSAALLSKPAEAVYDEFAPMMRDKSSLDTVVACLSQVRYDEQKQAYYLYDCSFNGSVHWQNEDARPLLDSLDPRWLELLTSPAVIQASKFKRLSQMMSYVDSVHTGNKIMEKYDVMLMGLINPHNRDTSAVLYRYFLQASKELYTDIHLYALYRLGHREFHDLLLQLVQKANFSAYQLKNVCNDLHLSREEEIKLLQGMLALIENGSLKNRYYTAGRLQSLLEQLQAGEEVTYW
ncbi:HEAT repeat domain-containing protein [Paenibacillus mendelii]|uniref:HEAT repeat domain-containing protein n=1 Tax=Paenibacillus mendelii TaxID=206163 RepID=A0ABV6JCB9_9BACL|nr:HEAT repeat domain-containing protein [Paenibacillus mendelii]MCQ6561541.1 HEAT repeat domain-containing protein [Paenibacillus mendelii]